MPRPGPVVHPKRLLHPDIPAYQRQPNESPHAYHGFQHYREIPFAVRSMGEAFRTHQVKCLEKPRDPEAQAPGSWQRWSQEWSWVARATVFDDETDRIAIAVESAKSETWAQAKVAFRIMWRDDMAHLYIRLRDRVKEMLDFPIKEVVVEDEAEPDERGVIVRRTVWMPVKWRYSDVARIMAMMQLLGGTIAGSPEDQASEEEALRAWAEREGIPLDKAVSEYRRIQKAMREGTG